MDLSNIVKDINDINAEITADLEDINEEVITNVEGEDTIEGTKEDDNLIGGMGDNTLIGLDGDDNLIGGLGNDSLTGNTGDDNLDGGLDNDLLDGLIGNDNLTGGLGNDELNGGENSDSLNGGIGDDLLDGDGGYDYLVGSIGADTLLGGGGKDSFFFAKIEPGSSGGAVEIINNNAFDGATVDTPINNVGGTSNVVVNGETIYSEPGEGTVTVNGEVIDEDELENDPVDTIDDFEASEGDKIFIDGDSFDVKPGDKSTLKFDSKTEVLSLADEPVFKISSGISSEIIENTEIIDSDDSVVIGADGGEII